jgi:hypothetical protein
MLSDGRYGPASAGLEKITFETMLGRATAGYAGSERNFSTRATERTHCCFMKFLAV